MAHREAGEAARRRLPARAERAGTADALNNEIRRLQNRTYTSFKTGL